MRSVRRPFQGHSLCFTIVASFLGLVAEASFAYAIVGVSYLVAEWCVKALALWLLGELGVPRAFFGFFADY